MHIQDLMKSIDKKYDATHVWFNQGLFSSKIEEGNNAKGVCLALAMNWLKSLDKFTFFSAPYSGFMHGDKPTATQNQQWNDINLDQAVFLQLRKKRLDRDDLPYFQDTNGIDHEPDSRGINHILACTDREGGFGKLRAIAIGDSRTYPWNPWGKLPNPDSYRKAICDDVTSIKDTQGACINVETAKAGHASAAIANRTSFLYFEPNGRMLEFASAAKFSEWFINELPNADEPIEYSRLTSVEVSHYQLSGGSPNDQDERKRQRDMRNELKRQRYKERGLQRAMSHLVRPTK
jgi:hypothetical protein